MHFCAQQIRACEDNAYAQRIAGITFTQLCDYLRKVPLINRVPRDGNHDCLPKIGSMGIRHASFKRLSAIRIDKRWRTSAGFETELIFHADAAEHGHEFIDRAKIGFASFFLDFFPGNVKADASQLMVCANAVGESVQRAGIFGHLLHDP